MNVALLLEHFDARRGGLEAWAVRFSAWLAKRGTGIHVIALDTASAAPDGVTIHTVAAGSCREDNARRFASCVGRIDVDVVHDLGVGFGSGVFHPQYGSRVACAEAEFRALPVGTQWRKRVSPIRWRRSRALRRFERAQMRSLDGLVIAPSRFAADLLQRRYGLPPSMLRTVYNGVDPAQFAAGALDPLRAPTRATLGYTPDQIVFLEVVVNFRLKGVVTALRALRGLPDSVRLVVAGSGPVDEFQRHARRWGVADRVHFTGGLADPRPVFAAADAYVHPSWHDACSLSVLEAWASGLPVITTPQNGASELMTAGEQGFLLPDPSDDHQLALLMGRLLDARVREAMAAKARQLAQQNSFDRQFEAIAGVHEEYLAMRGRSGV